MCPCVCPVAYVCKIYVCGFLARVKDALSGQFFFNEKFLWEPLPLLLHLSVHDTTRINDIHIDISRCKHLYPIWLFLYWDWRFWIFQNLYYYNNIILIKIPLNKYHYHSYYCCFHKDVEVLSYIDLNCHHSSSSSCLYTLETCTNSFH